MKDTESLHDTCF